MRTLYLESTVSSSAPRLREKTHGLKLRSPGLSALVCSPAFSPLDRDGGSPRPRRPRSGDKKWRSCGRDQAGAPRPAAGNSRRLPTARPLVEPVAGGSHDEPGDIPFSGQDRRPKGRPPAGREGDFGPAREEAPQGPISGIATSGCRATPDSPTRWRFGRVGGGRSRTASTSSSALPDASDRRSQQPRRANHRLVSPCSPGASPVPIRSTARGVQGTRSRTPPSTAGRLVNATSPQGLPAGQAGAPGAPSPWLLVGSTRFEDMGRCRRPHRHRKVPPLSPSAWLSRRGKDRKDWAIRTRSHLLTGS